MNSEEAKEIHRKEMKRLGGVLDKFINDNPRAKSKLPEIAIELEKMTKALQAAFDMMVSEDARVGIDELTAMLRDEDDDGSLR